MNANTASGSVTRRGALRGGVAVPIAVAAFIFVALFTVPWLFANRQMLTEGCRHPAYWATHTAWINDCANIARTQAIAFLVSLSAFLAFGVAGAMLALRGHQIIRFVPAVLATVAEARYVAFPFIRGSSTPLIYGWRPPSPPFLFSHEAVGALLVGLLLCLPPVLAQSDTSGGSTVWSRARLLAVLLVGAFGFAVLASVAPRGSAVLLLTALCLGVTARSRRQLGCSIGWVVLPALVLTLGEIPWSAVLTSDALRAVACSLVAVGAGASIDRIALLITPTTATTTQRATWDAPAAGV